jgi:glycosyltransferase involved in cell wall biosynthesis
MVDVDRVRELAGGEPADGMPEGGPVVAFFGRLESRKGVDVLAEAMRAVWSEIPEAHVVFIGRDTTLTRGTMGGRLREIAAGHEDRLHLLGPQQPERLFPALARADVVALPSRWENFATASLEAMALAKPMIVTSGSGYDDFFEAERDGLKVPPGEPDPLAEALLRLLRNPDEAARFGETAAQTSEAYRPEPVTRQRVAFFERVAARA